MAGPAAAVTHWSRRDVEILGVAWTASPPEHADIAALTCCNTWLNFILNLDMMLDGRQI